VVDEAVDHRDADEVVAKSRRSTIGAEQAHEIVEAEYEK
jgi:hypothetical protein